MDVGNNFTSGQYCRIEAGNKPGGRTLVIGNDVQINDKCHIAAIDSIIIGSNVLIASNVFITDHDHGDFSEAALSLAPAKRPLISKPVVIESGVWIGENVVILKGVLVGMGSIIAAGSIVTKSVPPFSLVCGVPAKVVKKLDR